MTYYDTTLRALAQTPRTWCVTGVAGFIGSNLLEKLLLQDQIVVGVDNFSTGHPHNLKQVRSLVSPKQWGRFRFQEADIRDPSACSEACTGVDYVLHQAAIGSVPRSIDDPVFTNQNNISGFLHMLVAARDARVKRFVYAASSSTYGDSPELPKQEERIGRPLSPYAVTKLVNELYAEVFGRVYGFEPIGLRYFNIFGPRQDPEGAYAAVIPQWFKGLLTGAQVYINGDGETSRDFCYVDNCVQANILAATTSNARAAGQVFNVAFGQRTTLNELYAMIRELVAARRPEAASQDPVYRDFRPGDVRHSLADTAKAHDLLGYTPQYSVRQGLERAAGWYGENL